MNSQKNNTPLDNSIKLMQKRETVILVDGVDTHYIKLSRREILECINNPVTWRVTVQHKNGNIYKMLNAHQLQVARDLLYTKKSYVWVIIGG
jgi:hypothetical protein